MPNDALVSLLSMVSQVFEKLVNKRLVDHLISLGILKLKYLIYQRLLTGFGMLVFFTNLFSAIEGLKWVWMGSSRKNTQLTLEFFKAPFLVLHFSYYTLMAFLILSVTLLSMLMILFSTQVQSGIWSVTTTRVDCWTWILYYFGRCSSELVQLVQLFNWFHFLILVGGLLVIKTDWMIFLLQLLDVTRMSTVFFPCTATLWNSLPLEYFPS